ncbi:MAG: hypothetical protein PHS41_00320 [Victivallaceae bacterium]|nr:hypothetical protein [Victivallaceae bacterium]
MKNSLYALLFLLVLTGPLTAFGQIAMSLKMNQQTYMLYEHIHAQLAMRNDSGRAIVFGEDPKLRGTLEFRIMDVQGRLIALLPGQKHSLTGTILKPGETKVIYFPLDAMYQLNHTGRFRATARVTHPLFKGGFVSGERPFEIVTGIDDWSRTAGVPDFLMRNPGGKVEHRTYRIKTMTDHVYRYYYMVLDDPRKVYSTRRLGKVFGNEKVRADVDLFSKLHAVVPIASKLVRYMVFDINGKLESSKYLRAGKTVPVLTRDQKTGRVFVVGGEPAVPGVDYELPRSPSKSFEAEADKMR